MKWLVDPVSKQPSVALTLLVFATVFMVAGTVMEVFTTLKSSHLLDEFWGSAVALYGGHLFANKPTDSPAQLRDIQR